MNVNFFGAIASFYRNYVNFSGRSTRAEYWWVVLYFFLALALLAGISTYITFNSDSLETFWVGPVLMIVFVVANIIPLLAIQARRFHDTGHSAWWILGFWAMSMGCNVLQHVVPIVGLLASGVISIWQIVWMASPSEYGENYWGPNPYGEGNEEYEVDNIY